MQKTAVLGVVALLVAGMLIAIGARVGSASHTTRTMNGASHKFIRPENMKWGPAPPVLPKGAQLTVLTGDPTKAGLYTMRLRMSKSYVVPPHWHSQGEYVTVISGTIHLGAGDKVDKTKSPALKAGSFAYLPAKMHHYAWSEGEAIVQLHGIGPFDIHYINAADNPLRKKTR